MIDVSKKHDTSNQSIEQIDYFMDSFKIENYNINNSKLSSPNNWTPFVDFNNNNNNNNYEDNEEQNNYYEN